jgi:hypothetical protein
MTTTSQSIIDLVANTIDKQSEHFLRVMIQISESISIKFEPYVSPYCVKHNDTKFITGS